MRAIRKTDTSCGKKKKKEETLTLVRVGCFWYITNVANLVLPEYV